MTQVCVGNSQSGGPDVAQNGDDSKKGGDDGVGYPTSSATNGTYMYIGNARLKRKLQAMLSFLPLISSGRASIRRSFCCHGQLIPTHIYMFISLSPGARACVKKPLLFVYSVSNGVFTASQWSDFPTKIQNASFVVPLSPSPLLSSDAVNLTVINQYYTPLAVDDITVPPNGAVSDVVRHTVLCRLASLRFIYGPD